MPRPQFDIYQTTTGYVAVTNPVRRDILLALADGDLELGDLVARTGKAKPTLSSVHMKDLLEQGLVVAETHPEDSRRKRYRLVARRIGSSDIPVANLRDAVRSYVAGGTPATRLALAAVLAAVASADGAAPAVLKAQAEALGRAAAARWQPPPGQPLVMAVAELLRREGVAEPRTIEVEAGVLLLAQGGGMDHVAAPAFGAVVGGFLGGLLDVPGVVVAPEPQGGRCRITLPTSVRN